MNYKLSEKILSEIKKAKKILVNCHRSPDADSVGSALALYEALLGIGKEAVVVCPDKIPSDLEFLPHSEKVKTIDFRTFDFGKYDLFMILDSASPNMLTKSKDISLPTIKKIVIDHHKTNEAFGEINLIDENISSTAELMYLVLVGLGVNLNKSMSQNLLAGIIADTGAFQFSNVTSQTLAIAQKLMDNGADRWEIILNVFKSLPFNKFKFWGEILKEMEWDKEHKFVWSAVPYDIYKEFEEPISAKESAATLFAAIVKDTDFGMIMVEEEKGILSVSLRGRTNFDVSRIAEKLGGGGHRSAAGAKVYNKDFDGAVVKVLEVARKMVNESKN